MDGYCAEIVQSLVAPRENNPDDIRIFHAWVEKWEKKKLGPSGDPIFEARLVRKYGGLKWLDPDSNFSRRVCHLERMLFTKARGTISMTYWLQ